MRDRPDMHNQPLEASLNLHKKRGQTSTRPHVEYGGSEHPDTAQRILTLLRSCCAPGRVELLAREGGESVRGPRRRPVPLAATGPQWPRLQHADRRPGRVVMTVHTLMVTPVDPRSAEAHGCLRMGRKRGARARSGRMAVNPGSPPASRSGRPSAARSPLRRPRRSRPDRSGARGFGRGRGGA